MVGSSCLQRKDGAALHSAVSSLANQLSTSKEVEENWRVLNVLHRVSACPATSDAVLWESCGLSDSKGVEETELSIFLCVCDCFVLFLSCYTNFGERDFQEIVLACFPCLFSCKCLFVSA